MTVCIAARSGTALFLVSDRMLTSGDVQFEPPAGKIIFVTSCIAVMAAGDSAFHHELMTDVWKEVAQVIERKPEEWIGVRHVVDMYINYRNMAKRKRSEASILAPLGLNHSSFLDQQRTMSDDLVREITTDLINFDLPDVQVIVAGIDTYMDGSKPNTHIYSIHNDFVSCDDIIGFRAIGSGARHAESQFMLAGHSWNNDPHATVMLTYRAKKDSEVAPGVGTETDMYIIAGLGNSDRVRDEVIQRMDREYRKIKIRQARMHANAASEIRNYVNTLPSAPAAQADRPSPETSTTPAIDNQAHAAESREKPAQEGRQGEADGGKEVN